MLVSFHVEKEGTISNVAVVQGLGYGCDEEAVRIVSKFPTWKPEWKGSQVKIYRPNNIQDLRIELLKYGLPFETVVISSVRFVQMSPSP
jgi:hypothetical protein